MATYPTEIKSNPLRGLIILSLPAEGFNWAFGPDLKSFWPRGRTCGQTLGMPTYWVNGVMAGFQPNRPVAIEINPIFKVGGAGGWWIWPNPAIGLMGLWPVYKPSFNPIGLVAIEIQPHFQSGRGRGLVDMAKPRHRFNGVMLGLYTKLEPNGLSYIKNTAFIT